MTDKGWTARAHFFGGEKGENPTSAHIVWLRASNFCTVTNLVKATVYRRITSPTYREPSLGGRANILETPRTIFSQLLIVSDRIRHGNGTRKGWFLGSTTPSKILTRTRVIRDCRYTTVSLRWCYSYNSTAIRPRYDHSTLRPIGSGLQHCSVNIQIRRRHRV